MLYSIGDNAAEIVHIGQAVLSLGATIEYFRDTVFNYPISAEAYKLTALDGLPLFFREIFPERNFHRGEFFPVALVR